MVNMLRGKHILGFILNSIKLKENDKGVSTAKIYLNVMDKRRFVNKETKEVEYRSYYTTLPFHLYGHVAEYASKYLVEGQKILIEYSIDSFKSRDNSNPSYPHPYFIATSIVPQEKTEDAEERMLYLKMQRQKKREAKEESKKSEENNVNVNEEDELDYEVYQHNFTYSDISDKELDEDLPF